LGSTHPITRYLLIEIHSSHALICFVHELISKAAFELYELHLFSLVVKHRSFTRAAAMAGITQSAITRQMQGLEENLGVDLLERTTRSVRVTEAGTALFHEASRLLGNAGEALQRFHEQFANSRREIRVGISRSIALAHLPGIFHANLRRAPDVGLRVSYDTSANVLSLLEENEIDIGVLSRPQKLPDGLRITHKFEDGFTLIAPESLAPQIVTSRRLEPKRLQKWAELQTWLLLDEKTSTGQQLRKWLNKQGWNVKPSMQLDSFDLIINLVSLGMGVSLIPTRALALYGRKKNIRRISVTGRFTRELVVVIRKHRKMPPHFEQFVENILF
jgi:DNA-binding transcriptional LysR family regulator